MMDWQVGMEVRRLLRLHPAFTGKASYGERLLDVQTAQAVYAAMGPVFPENGQTRYYIICPDDKFEALFGRRADKRRKLYNGMIPCQLYSYYEDALRARAARRRAQED